MKEVQNLHISNIQKLLEKGANIHVKDKNGNTAASIADSLGMTGLLDVLKLSKADCRKKITPIMKAVKALNSNVLELLLKQNIFNVNSREQSGCCNNRSDDMDYDDTALTMVINSKWNHSSHPYFDEWNQLYVKSTGDREFLDMIDQKYDSYDLNAHNMPYFDARDLEMISLLVKHGANIHQGGKYGPRNSPLEVACAIGNLNMVNILLENQSTLEADSSYSYHFALEAAVKNNQYDIIKVLCPFVKNVSLKADLYEQPLHLALKNGLYDGIISKLLDAIKEFDYSKAMSVAVKAGKYNGYNLIKEANPEAFKELIIQDGTKWLCEACAGDCYEIVENLLSSGAQVSTPSHVPILFCKSLNVFKLLLKNGADINQPGYLELSTKRTYQEIVKGHMQRRLPDYIEPHSYKDVKVTPLCSTVFSVEMFEFAIAQGAKVNSLFLRYVLTLKNVSQEIRTLILKHMEDIDPNEVFQTIDKDIFDSSIHYRYQTVSLFALAVKYENLFFAEEFIKRGADINKRFKGDSKTGTALMMAAKSNSALTSLLIRNGADLDVTDDCDGQFTALMIAAYYKNYQSFSYLVEAGASSELKWNDDENLLSTLLRADNFLDRKDMIICLASNGVTAHLNEDVFAIHKCIAGKAFDVFGALIRHAGFSPLVYDSNSMHAYFNYDTERNEREMFTVRDSFLRDVEGIFSPLCMALVCGLVSVAKDMIEAHFITTSDLYLLPNHKRLRARLEYLDIENSLAFLDMMTSSPPSLMQLCFAKVSDLIGPPPERQTSVKTLGLPSSIQNALMFKDQFGGRKYCGGKQLSNSSPSGETDEAAHDPEIPWKFDEHISEDLFFDDDEDNYYTHEEIIEMELEDENNYSPEFADIFRDGEYMGVDDPDEFFDYGDSD